MKFPFLPSLTAGALALGLTACAGNRVRIEPTPATAAWLEPGVIAPVAAPAVQPPIGPAPAPTATGYQLSVEDAVFLALRNNRNLRIQELEPVRAGAFLLTERGAFEPELFATYQYEVESVSETDRGTGSAFNVEGNDHSGTVGIRQTLPTGTEVELGVRQARSVSSRTPEDQSARVGLSVTQSLLRGFGPAANLANIRAARLAQAASEAELAGFTEALVAEVETAYWQYRRAREEITVFERSLAVAEQQQSEIEAQIEVGTLPNIAAAAIRAEVARRQQELIDARSLATARRLRLAQLILPPGVPLESTTLEPIAPAALPDDTITDASDRLQLALQARPDLQEALRRYEQGQLEVTHTRNGLLPRLDLFLDYGKTGYAQLFQRTFENLSDDTYDLTVGVEFDLPLGNRAARGRELAARVDRDQALEAVRNLERLIELDMLLALNEVERLRQQVDATARRLELQRLAAQAEQDRFDFGTGTSLQLAQAQRDLLEAEIDAVGARIDYRIALVNLHLAEGSLLARRGITLPAKTAG